MIALARLAVVLAALLGAVTGAAQVTADPPPPAVAPVTLPVPTKLAADWWGYFESARPEELADRAERFQQVLDEVSAGLVAAGGRAGEVRALVVEIHGLLDALVDSTESSPKVESVTVPPTPERYSLEALLQLAVKRQDLELEADLATGEAREQDAAVRVARQFIDDAMAAYLTLDAAASERLEQGLLIVRARLLWALGVEQLKRHKVRETQLLAELELVTEQIAHGRVSIADEGDSSAWHKQLGEARDERVQLTAAAASARLRSAVLDDSARGQSLRRGQQQLLLNLEAQSLAADLRAGEAELALAMQALARGEEGSEESVRRLRNEVQELLSGGLRRAPAWRRATDRERAAANEQLIGASEVPPSLLRERVAQADATLKTAASARRQFARGQLLVGIATDRLVSESGRASELAAESARVLGELWDDIVRISGASLFTVNETPVTSLGLVRLTVIVFLAWLLSRLVRKGFEGLLGRRETMDRASIYTLSRLFHYVILVVGFLVALSSIGIDFTKFALIASAFGVGLGFGLQAIFSNFVAGLIILFERSLKVGDYVELESGVGGEVQGISIRSTLVTTNDNVDILVPNSEFVNGRVTNWTLREAYRRIRVPFGVAYGTDKELTRRAVLEAAIAVPHTLRTTGRDPQVWLVGFGASSLDFELVVWLIPAAVKSPSRVQADFCWAIESALGRHGIEIPFPQRDLHLRSVFGARDAQTLDALHPPAAPERQRP